MDIPRPAGARVRDIAFFAVFLVYVWAGIDARLIYHWQGPVFYTMPGFVDEFLKYPGGPADYLYALIAQAYAFAGWGAVVLTAPVAAVAALTQVYFTTLAGRALPLVRFVPAALLLYYVNLYYDRTPIVLALLLGLALATLFVYLSRRWRSEAALLGAFVAMLVAAYYLGGMAIVFFAPAAVIVRVARRPRFPLWIAYLPLAAALPAAVELLRPIYMPASARDWFMPPDVRRAVVYWGLYVFYALGTAIALRAGPRPAQASPKVGRSETRPTLAALLAITLLLLGLGSVAAVSYHLNSRDRRLVALDYYSFSENWPAVIDASRRLAAKDFNSLNCYEINLALHEMNRLGDDMFGFPQTGFMLPDLHDDRFLPYMFKITDLCLRLGRVNEAEHFGSEAMVLGRSDPRVYRLMARVDMVKGQTAAARKFLTVLSYDLGSGPWARQRLRELDSDPQLAGDRQVQLLRRRMLRNDDVLPVWQRADKSSADMERLLLDQLEQDPSNRMAFEFLMGAYLLARNMVAINALMPRIKDMAGPAYAGPDGRRRTPRHYQEAMAIYADVTGRPVNIAGFEIQPETSRRMAEFKRIMRERFTKDAAMQAAWSDFRHTYFFYFAFGPGDYR
ncbi:MAG: DUF6057 family protein [Bryobacteraceae bacterium]|jgi:hypothetical protein